MGYGVAVVWKMNGVCLFCFVCFAVVARCMYVCVNVCVCREDV